MFQVFPLNEVYTTVLVEGATVIWKMQDRSDNNAREAVDVNESVG